MVWLSTSRDFVVWSDAACVLASDAADNDWADGASGQKTDIYDMSVVAHATGFLGWPAVFRIQEVRTRDEKRTDQSGQDGPIDIELATSRDGRLWKRSSPRIPMIPRGAPGTFDGGALLGVGNGVVHTATETWMYYTAINTGHGGPMPPKRLTIGRAEWRLHGFVSLDAGPDGGRIETVPLRAGGAALVVNADAARGELRAGLLGEDGAAIAGFGVMDCEPLRGDSTGWRIRWKAGAAVPADRPVRVVVEMAAARLYSIHFE